MIIYGITCYSLPIYMIHAHARARARARTHTHTHTHTQNDSYANTHSRRLL